MAGAPIPSTLSEYALDSKELNRIATAIGYYVGAHELALIAVAIRSGLRTRVVLVNDAERPLPPRAEVTVDGMRIRLLSLWRRIPEESFRLDVGASPKILVVPPGGFKSTFKNLHDAALKRGGTPAEAASPVWELDDLVTVDLDADGETAAVPASRLVKRRALELYRATVTKLDDYSEAFILGPLTDEVHESYLPGERIRLPQPRLDRMGGVERDELLALVKLHWIIAADTLTTVLREHSRATKADPGLAPTLLLHSLEELLISVDGKPILDLSLPQQMLVFHGTFDLPVLFLRGIRKGASVDEAIDLAVGDSLFYQALLMLGQHKQGPLHFLSWLADADYDRFSAAAPAVQGVTSEELFGTGTATTAASSAS